MNQTLSIDCPGDIDALLHHIQERTFGRLHDLNVVRGVDGRIHVSAIAHSRFVGQLAEWAILERVAPEDVELSIRVCLSSPHFNGVQK